MHQVRNEPGEAQHPPEKTRRACFVHLASVCFSPQNEVRPAGPAGGMSAWASPQEGGSAVRSLPRQGQGWLLCLHPWALGPVGHAVSPCAECWRRSSPRHTSSCCRLVRSAGDWVLASFNQPVISGRWAFSFQSLKQTGCPQGCPCALALLRRATWSMISITSFDDVLVLFLKKNLAPEVRFMPSV